MPDTVHPLHHPAGPCQHTSIIMLWMLWEKVDLPRPPNAHPMPQSARNSELSCCCCCCCSRNAVEVCGHILARMFLYQTRLDATRPDQRPSQRCEARPDQTVVRVPALSASGTRQQAAGILYFLPVVTRSAFASGNLFRIWH